MLPTHPRRAALPAALLALAAAPSAAQQFSYQPGLIPGTPRWTEGVEAADVDQDGDLDLFFAEGEGFSGAGPKRQNVLVINQLIETGSLAFTDESIPRLGVHESNAKGVVTGDVNGDGWVDALYANAFNTDLPFLYINRGAMAPGFFTEDGVARGLTEILSSASGQFADVDDDGDLDLFLCDSGNSFLGGSGAQPRLYENDGSGNFSEVTGPAWNPAVKRAHMDVQMVNVDGDWDLDFFGFNRASNSGGTHYLMRNDGASGWTEISSTVPNTSSSVYEAEVGDLDDDTDIDIFFVSLSGFQEGAMRNNLIPSGTLGFTSQGGLPLSQDDNEIVLLDFDLDGDLDSFVGSLGSKERLWRNDGGFNYTASHGSIQTVSDSTLDMTAADLDNDGDYDLVTAQGESNSPQWVSKVYLNSGPADDLPPVVVAVDPVGQLDSDTGPWVAHAKVRDQVLDDGINYVRAFSRFVVNPTPLTGSVTITPGGAAPITVAPGTTVTFTNASGVDQTVTSTTAPWAYDSGVIPAGGDWSRTFVTPGLYDYSVSPGGFAGTVNVTGAAAQEKALYSGGQQYRFAMAGDASSADAQLCYELFFVDWVGNASVSESACASKPGGTGTGFCFGDGSGTPCPCANGGTQGNGCANGSFMMGSNLAATGDASVGADTMVLVATTSTPGQPGLFFQGNNEVGGGDGAQFGDGLRCAGMAVIRLQTVSANGSGEAMSSIAIGAKGGVTMGDTKLYQWWYRDPSLSPCGQLFNLSNGLRVTWTP